MPATVNGKAAALNALADRRANMPDQINNADLPAGSPMYFYCNTCGHVSDTKPETFTDAPNHTCVECQALIDLGWME